MVLRSPQSVGECSVSSLNRGSHQLPKAARTFLVRKAREKEKQAWPLDIRAFSSLQQEKEPSEGSQRTQQSAQTQLELLGKLALGREKGKFDPDKYTIAEQLASKVIVDADDEVVVPLGKQIPREYDDLTLAQKRNIRRQKYLDQVSQRNDTPFFATIALLVILPPVVILGVAVATGYVNFLP